MLTVEKKEHSFIFYTAYSIVGHRGAGAYLPQSIGKVHPGQVANPSQGNIQDKQPCTHSFTPKGNLERPVNLTVIFFGLWEEAIVPGENPCMHRVNMQTLVPKDPGWESNTGPSCCKATVLPTVPPSSPN
ncbi:hypothetical protein XENOCAPTIV_020728 [Xenoophorus captivus]|uniref:Uncharacterized protein n=1 Tax=Xenoophorus captivus TaxID=1517983 RepID=A0ABV0QSW1_9TELE